MSVTSKKRKEDPLTLYVDFLNVDLSVDPRPKLKKGQKLKDFLNQFERDEILPDKFNLSTGEPKLKPYYSFLVFLYFKYFPFLAYIYFRFVVWLEKAKSLQEEMRTDLFPIAARKAIPEKIFPLFERWACLTEKLNEMQFIRRWDPHPPKNKKGRVIIKGWNFKPSYDQRDIWYMGLAERLEDGDLEKLRLCPVCSRYFAAIKSTDRFCRFLCKNKYDNKDAKFRVKRWRAKQKGGKVGKKQESRNREYEQKEIDKKVRRFSEFVPFAIKHCHPDYKEVGRIVKTLGEEDSKEGWKRVEKWYNDLKNGISPEQIFKELPQTIKDYF